MFKEYPNRSFSHHESLRKQQKFHGYFETKGKTYIVVTDAQQSGCPHQRTLEGQGLKRDKNLIFLLLFS